MTIVLLKHVLNWLRYRQQRRTHSAQVDYHDDEKNDRERAVSEPLADKHHCDEDDREFGRIADAFDRNDGTANERETSRSFALASALIYSVWACYCLTRHCIEISVLLRAPDFETTSETMMTTMYDVRADDIAELRARCSAIFRFDDISKELFARCCLYLTSFCFGVMLLVDYGIPRRWYRRTIRLAHRIVTLTALSGYIAVLCAQHFPLLIDRENKALDMCVSDDSEIDDESERAVLSLQYALTKAAFVRRLMPAIMALTYVMLESIVVETNESIHVVDISMDDRGDCGLSRFTLLALLAFRHIIWFYLAALPTVRVAATISLFAHCAYFVTYYTIAFWRRNDRPTVKDVKTAKK